MFHMKIISFPERCSISSPLNPQCLFHMRCLQVDHISNTAFFNFKKPKSRAVLMHLLHFTLVVSTKYSTHGDNFEYYFVIQCVYNTYTPDQYSFYIFLLYHAYMSLQSTRPRRKPVAYHGSLSWLFSH